MRYDSLIFDLDGTLWDSTEGVRTSWGKILMQQPDIYALPTAQALEKVMGLSSGDLMRTLYPQLSDERGQEIFNLCCEEENKYLLQHGGLLYEGIEETIKALSLRFPLFIVSNCNEGYIETFLQAHAMKPYFQDWECYGHTRQEKSKNIQLVIQRNNLKQPIYIGDTIWDYEAATKAGIAFLHAGYGFGGQLDTPHISSPAQLIDFL